MFTRFLLLALIFAVSASHAQQKKSLSHKDYDLWKKIDHTQVSNNGDIVVTTISTSTGRGDGYLKIHNVRTGKTFQFKNGYKTGISHDGHYVFFLRKLAYRLERKERKEDVKKDQRTKDDFFVYDVRKNQLTDSMMRIKSYKIPKESSGWVVLEHHKNEPPKKDKADSSEVKKDQKKPIKRLAEKADYGIVYNIKKQSRDTLFQLKDFQLPREGQQFIFSTSEGEKKTDLGVFLYDVQNGSQTLLDSSHYTYKGLSIDHTGRQMAFLAAQDSVKSDSLKYELFYVNHKLPIKIVDSLGKNLRKDWELSAVQRPYFSKDGKRLFFYSRPKRHFHRDTTFLDDEIPEVDIWSYHDKLIQPEQKAKLKQLEDKAYQSFYNTDTQKIISLHDQRMEYISFDQEHTQRYVLGYTNSPYQIERSWDYPSLQDYFIVDTHTGEKRLALKGTSGRPILAPDHKHAVYYDQEEKSWWSLNLETNTKVNLTRNLTVNFFDEKNDRPMLPRAYGFGGFTKDGQALVYDQYDIWSLELSGTDKPKNITRTGRENNIEFRSFRLDPEYRTKTTYYDKGILISAFDKTNKSSSLFSLNPKNGKKQSLIETDNFLITGVDKAKNGTTLVFQKENFQHFPDLYIINKRGAEADRITDANPQHNHFKWGSVELVSWQAYDGETLEGLLYKPEDFDPNKKYPMIAYFYERRSDTYNRYHTPKPSASTVNMSYLVSNGYVAFVPDIVYKLGQPGPDAYNSIVSGVEAMEAKGFIDSNNMALQGQSWGGYQTAYLITVTNKFKAAMAGAPVSNMTSAYGGIRWRSGMSRAFQYEKTQSRIGKNLWDGLDLYLKNSPLFGIPNIETPLLMMHNDADGAVPYYQGIEMFMGMRRLNKPVWLLVYNNEAHNLSKLKNKQDLSIRMMQFFDHYLKDAPAPLWMTEGLPHIMKGKDLRYELDKD
ncbi:alpha/beta hydrolase family protein [Gelidibacter maritimus]|uniref:S9 family peptidase n=1 Tax=Gelidibacter maritimus TaxID=2761487 RepID=A0A7W2R3J5_9FLAO|nr:prolyl oligopeptidase family serine peptidase [Gelidibacter maritimus]MBA6152080.1 S9 family peptidase [Gelidibacter maritimus]